MTGNEAAELKLLVLQAQLGREAAFEALINRHEARLFAYIRAIVGCEATAFDVLQETWILVIRRIWQLRSPEAFGTWLFRVARNCAWKAVKARIEESAALDDLPVPERADDAGPDLELRELAAAGMKALPEALREVMHLKFMEGMPLGDIAAVLGLPEGTVKSRLYWARQKLNEFMARRENHEKHDRNGV